MSSPPPFLRLSKLKYEPFALFLGFSILYVFLAWVVCGGDKWWVIDYVDNSNVFYGDDAYRFFLARSAWVNPDLYTYNFVLPAFLFLEGVVVHIAGGDLFLSRSIHAFMGGLSVALIWSSGRLLGIGRVIMYLAVMIMGLLPRFALTSLSFYGEAWLVFFLCLLIFLFLHKRYFLVAIFSSLLPLIRPEGMFFWAPIFLFMVMNKSWKEAVVMLVPGLIYFLYINLALPSLSDYVYWRAELRNILNKLVLNESPMDWVKTYSLLLVIPAFWGFLYKPVRTIWPFLIGGLAWFVWLLTLVFAGYSDYEDRYTYILIPIIVILWSGFFAWIFSEASKYRFSARFFHCLAFVLALVIVVSHFGNMYMLKGSVHHSGFYPTFGNVLMGRWDRLFMYDPPERVKAWQDGAAKIQHMLAGDEAIDRVVIFDHGFYYYLNPAIIPGHVTVGYATNGYRVFHILFDGQVFTQHSGGKMYSYLEFEEPQYSEGERRALYVDMMPLSGYPYKWDFAGYEMYLFSYQDSLVPKKSLENAPMIDLELMKKAYEKWW